MEKRTSWNQFAKGYHKSVGEEGNFYHQKVIMPKVLRLLGLRRSSNLLDLACGQGVLSRNIPEIARYVGIDIAPDLIKEAIKINKRQYHSFYVADASKPLQIKDRSFSHATCILAVQNIEDLIGLVKNAAYFLKPGGKFVIVMNHPYFRIPKLTSWHINEEEMIQSRLVDAYMSQLEIPIDMTPGSKRDKTYTVSFHRPLAYYTDVLMKAGFYIEKLEEWISPKQSFGRSDVAEMENIARAEFPMFMALVAVKKPQGDYGSRFANEE